MPTTNCEPLLELCGPGIYSRNAFRLLGADVDQKGRRIKRIEKEFEAAIEVGELAEEYCVALLPARYFTLTEAVPDLEITLELAYTQQIRLDREGAELAREPGFSHTLEKEFDWNVAFTQKYFDGQVRPVFELLGTTTVDAIDEDDEGTILELAAGFWLIPHADEHLFSAFSYGLGFRVPVTSRNEDQGAVMLVIEHSFD